MKPTLSVITLVNDAEAYAISRATLAAQHDPGDLEWLPIEADARGWSAAQGLNAGLEGCHAEWAACAHQDVLFPKGWWRGASARIRELPPTVGVVALVGLDRGGAFRGHVLDPHGHCRWGPLPSPVLSLDEHVILIRTATGLRFDPAAPGFHCYGTDLALQAEHEGVGVFAIDAPVVHLSGGRKDARFDSAARWLFAKWRPSCGGVLPTPSTLLWDRSPRSILRWLCAKVARRRSRSRRHAGPAPIGER
jgi:hypothetical protein